MTATPALGDGLSSVPYNYVHPPPFLASTNLSPRSGTKTFSLGKNALPADVAATADAQASISFSKQAWPHIPGQRAVRLVITPLAKYPALPKDGTLDGNVYGFHATFVPSGKPISRLANRILVTLEYPHTPYVFLVFDAGHWRTLCDENTMIMTPATASCYERTLYGAVALLYHPIHGIGSPAGRPTPTPTRAPKAKPQSNRSLQIALVGVIALTVLAAGGLVVLIVRRRGSSSG